MKHCVATAEVLDIFEDLQKVTERGFDEGIEFQVRGRTVQEM